MIVFYHITLYYTCGVTNSSNHIHDTVYTKYDIMCIFDFMILERIEISIDPAQGCECSSTRVVASSIPGGCT